jgi:hypothetical protein
MKEAFWVFNDGKHVAKLRLNERNSRSHKKEIEIVRRVHSIDKFRFVEVIP